MLIVCLVAATLAVARLTMLLTQDQLTVGYRRWVIRRWGKESWQAYLVHCDWRTSMWVALPIMPVVAAWPNRWVLAVLSIPVASLVAGLLSKLRG